MIFVFVLLFFFCIALHSKDDESVYFPKVCLRNERESERLSPPLTCRVYCMKSEEGSILFAALRRRRDYLVIGGGA